MTSNLVKSFLTELIEQKQMIKRRRESGAS